MTEPIDQPTKDLIENEAEKFINKNVFGDPEYITIVSPKGCYIAGATNSFKYLEKLLNEKLYKEVESLREQLAKLETQSHDQVMIIEHLEQELAKERELRKELVDGLKDIEINHPQPFHLQNKIESLIQKAKDKSHE